MTNNKKTDHWYPRYVADYVKKTQHLTLAEHGAYTLLLDYYYAIGRPQANASVLLRVCRAFEDHEKEAVHSVVRQFFTEVDGELINYRAEIELSKRLEISKKRGWAGSIGAEKKKAKRQQTGKQNASKPEANAYTSTSTSTLEVTNVTSPPTPKAIVVTDEQFEELWRTYPAVRDKGSKWKARDQIEAKIKKGTSYETIRDGVDRYRRYIDSTGEMQPDFFRWIRDGGYERPYAIPAESAPKHGRAGGYSLQAVLDQALADHTRRPSISPERAAALGLLPDSSDV